MKKTTPFLVTILSITALAACSPGTPNSGNVVIPVSASAINASDATPETKAEELAKGAETLLSGDGIQQASAMAELALKADAKNFRAQLIQKFLAPLVLQKGIVRRLRPLAEKNPRALEKLNKSTARLEAQAQDSAGAAFLLDGSPDLRTEAELQRHLDRTIDAVEDFRGFLRTNKDREITLKVASAFKRDLAERYAAACEIKINDNFEYELICPPSFTRTSVSLNRADFEVFHDIITYYLLQLMVPNAFELDGAVAEMASDTTTQSIYERLMKNSQFGRARESKYLKRVRSMGIDLVTSLNWAMANQATICPKSSMLYTPNARTQRPGMLFNNGFCTWGLAFKPVVDTIALNLSGEARSAEITVNGALTTTKIFWLAPFEQPIADLRDLGTLNFKDNGDLESTTSPTMGGIFPNGDANFFLNHRDSQMVYH